MEPQTEKLLRKSAADEAVVTLAGVSAEIAVFHAQQACEKLLKALLTELGQSYPYTHDLPTLAALIALHDQPVPSLPVPLGRLTDFAVIYRYDEVQPAAAIDPADASASAAKLRSHVEARIEAITTARHPSPPPP